MRFQDHLLLQKQHAEEQERQSVAQRILDEASAKIGTIYSSRRRFRDPLEESKARIKTLQRRAASASGPATADETQLTASMRSSRAASISGQAVAVNPDYVTREVTVRHLNDHTNLNPTAFRLYRKLRFG